MSDQTVGQGGLRPQYAGALIGAVLGMVSFLVSDFVDGRDLNVTGIETRLSADIAEVKDLLRDFTTTTRGNIERLTAKVSENEARWRATQMQIEGMDRRLERMSDLIRERTLEKME